MTRYAAMEDITYHLSWALRHAAVLMDRTVSGSSNEARAEMLALLIKDLVHVDRALEAYVNKEKKAS